MNEWQQRRFGNTGLMVSALGFGAGHIGDHALAEADVGYLLNSLLDMGITLIDTARGYDLSEQRIGRHLAHRRHEFVLSTKVGYDIEGYNDWTAAIITAGVDAALERLNTDYLDIVHLHSCPLEMLEHGEVVTALQKAVEAGKVRVAAYSGDNEAVEWAARSGAFGSIELSVNICDQRAIDGAIALAQEHDLGVIAKRPVANAPWRFDRRPVGHYAEVYWARLHAMNIDPAPFSWQELALRFTAYLDGVHSCIVGSTNMDHMRQNLAIIEQGALPAETVAMLRQAFKQHDHDWIGQI